MHTKFQRAQNYIDRAIAIKDKNPEFADRLWEAGKAEMFEAIKEAQAINQIFKEHLPFFKRQ